jgi:adenylate kinase
MFNLVLSGSPGSGKGTQSELISKRYNLRRISTGNIFRKKMINKTELKLKAATYVENGKPTPKHLLVNIAMRF